MSLVEEFLNSDLSDYKEFTKKFLLAALEVRGNELGLSYADLSMEGDIDAKNEINHFSIRPHTYILENEVPTNIPNQIKNALSYLETGKASTFRGTRLPDISSSFQMGGIHTTPELTVAHAYANGDTNNSTGIGRIGNDYQLGFIHHYEVDINTICYKNFEYEDIQKGKLEPSTKSLNDLKEALKELSNKESNSFYLDAKRVPSENMKTWYQFMNNHYEVILDEKAPVKHSYLTYKQGILKINHQNPQWNKILTRLQEAQLRDFYEIRPIEMIIKYTKNASTFDNVENEEILSEFTKLASNVLNENKHSSWQANNLDDLSLANKNASYMNSHPYILQSQYIGSAMETKNLCYSEKVSTILKIGKHIQYGEFSEAKSILDSLNYDAKTHLKNNIANLREKLKQNTNNQLNEVNKTTLSM